MYWDIEEERSGSKTHQHPGRWTWSLFGSPKRAWIFQPRKNQQQYPADFSRFVGCTDIPSPIPWLILLFQRKQHLPLVLESLEYLDLFMSKFPQFPLGRYQTRKKSAGDIPVLILFMWSLGIQPLGVTSQW